MALAMRFVASANAGGESLPATSNVGWTIVPSCSALTSRRPPRCLGDDRRAVGGEDLLHRLGQGLPSLHRRATPRSNVSATVLMSASAAAKTCSSSSASHRVERLAERQPAALQQRQRADTVRVPQREVDRDLAALAAPDHDRRRRRERVDQRCRIVGVLVHVRDKAAPGARCGRTRGGRTGSCARASPTRQPRRSRGRPSCPVPWMHRIGSPGPVLLVVERHTVDADLGHAASMRPAGAARIGRTPHFR